MQSRRHPGTMRSVQRGGERGGRFASIENDEDIQRAIQRIINQVTQFVPCRSKGPNLCGARFDTVVGVLGEPVVSRTSTSRPIVGYLGGFRGWTSLQRRTWSELQLGGAGLGQGEVRALGTAAGVFPEAEPLWPLPVTAGRAATGPTCPGIAATARPWPVNRQDH